MDINYILLDLEIIKQIKENDKLGLIVLPGTKKLFVDTSTTLSGLRRWYSGNNREDTINYIEDLFGKIERTSNLLVNGKHKNLSSTLQKSLTESKRGLENLKKTYETDSITVAKLVLIINKLNIIIKLLNLPIEENELLNNISNELLDDINNDVFSNNEITQLN